MSDLTKKQLEILAQYEHTSDGEFMQGMRGSSELWSPMGLLEWRGDSFGCHFFSITEAGRAELAADRQVRAA